MVRFISRRRIQLRSAAVHLTITAAFTLVFAASQTIAQQSPSVGMTPPITTGSPQLNTNPVSAPVLVSRVLDCQEAHCGHVIDLLIRNRLRHQTGSPGAELAPGLFLSVPPSAAQLGDLELLNVNLVADGSPGVGPLIQLEIRNSSSMAIGDFQISVVGVRGQIHVHCPAIQGTVSTVPACSVSQFQLQLPASVMSLGPSGQQPVEFDTIVVALDSFDELVEANELNNVRIIRRADLVQSIVPSVAASTAIPPAVSEEPATRPPADTAIPSPDQPASPLDSFMLEDRSLETTPVGKDAS